MKNILLGLLIVGSLVAAFLVARPFLFRREKYYLRGEEVTGASRWETVWGRITERWLP